MIIEGTIVFIESWFFLLAITLPFDIRDVAVDRTQNLQTLTTVYGKKKSIQLAIAFSSISFALHCMYNYIFLSNIGLLCANVLVFVCVVMSLLLLRTRKGNLLINGIIDGFLGLKGIFIIYFTCAVIRIFSPFYF